MLYYALKRLLTTALTILGALVVLFIAARGFLSARFTDPPDRVAVAAVKAEDTPADHPGDTPPEPGGGKVDV